jgi:hypothetical protein
MKAADNPPVSNTSVDHKARTRKFFTGSDENEVRNKIAMVLFALEKSVGDRLVEESEIHRDAVSENYFLDIIEHAAVARKGTDTGDAYKDLRDLLERYKIVDIRNAVSHPNRGVFDNYWLRIAALATDPCIERLGLNEVKEAFAAAHLGRITAPPTHWFLAKNFSVPNTLPEQTDFDITGFVGRQTDKTNLRQMIESRRLPSLALVGHGGTGKTALVLSLLRSMVHDHETEKWCAAILYVSAKKEELTTEGIKPLVVDAAIDSVLRQLREQAQDIGCENYLNEGGPELDGKKIVVCIDNFDTVPEENDKAIATLHASLPEHVKLILTSRFPIDGVASCVLKNLQEGDAIKLAKRYAERCGGVQLSAQALVRIVRNVDGIPLAIKLAIDLYNRGYSEAIATGKAKNEVVAFSFSNLLDRLSDVELELIEFLFLMGQPASRGNAVSVLGYEEEIVSSALINLSRTSLVRRIQADGRDLFDLNDNIRSLIVKNDKHVKTRSRIRARLKKRKDEIRVHESLQRDGKIQPSSEDYVAPDTPEALKPLLISGVRILKAKRIQHCGRWLHEAEQVSGEFPEHPRLLHIKGRVLTLLGDSTSAVEALEKAVALQPDSPWPVLALADALLDLIQEDKSKEAETLLMQLKPRDILEISPSAYRRYWKLIYKCFKAADRWTDVLELAEGMLKVDDDGVAKEIHLENAAYASFKAVRYSHFQDPPKVSEGMLKAASYFQMLVEKSGLMDHQVRMCLTYFKELRHFIQEHEGRGVPQQQELLAAAGNLADSMLSMRLVSGVLFDQCLAVCGDLGLFDCPDGQSQPLVRWAPRKLSLADLDEKFMERIYRDGQIIAWAKVSRSTLEKGYLFAQCIRSSATYFLHISKTDTSKGQFAALQRDTLLLIDPDPESEPEKPAAAKWEILCLDEIKRPVTLVGDAVRP